MYNICSGSECLRPPELCYGENEEVEGKLGTKGHSNSLSFSGNRISLALQKSSLAANSSQLTILKPPGNWGFKSEVGVTAS